MIPATALADRDRVVRPGGTFKLGPNLLIQEVRIDGGAKLRLRCIGDGCDWTQRGRPRRVLANISELDRRFRSFARVPLRVTLRRRDAG